MKKEFDHTVVEVGEDPYLLYKERKEDLRFSKAIKDYTMLKLAKALEGITDALVKLQENLHIDLVEIKEELRGNNKGISFIGEEIKKESEYIKKQIEAEDELVQLTKEKESKTIANLIKAIKDLEKISIMQRTEIEILKMKIQDVEGSND